MIRSTILLFRFGIVDHLDQFYYSKQELKLEKVDLRLYVYINIVFLSIASIIIIYFQVDVNFTENVHEMYQNVIEKRIRRGKDE